MSLIYEHTLIYILLHVRRHHSETLGLKRLKFGMYSPKTWVNIIIKDMGMIMVVVCHCHIHRLFMDKSG